MGRWGFIGLALVALGTGVHSQLNGTLRLLPSPGDAVCLDGRCVWVLVDVVGAVGVVNSPLQCGGVPTHCGRCYAAASAITWFLTSLPVAVTDLPASPVLPLAVPLVTTSRQVWARTQPSW